MQLVDSNIIIYAAKPDGGIFRRILTDEICLVSVVSRVEVLGFHGMGSEERDLLERLFATIPMLRITDPVVEQAIALKQVRRMSLGDALIAATALHHDLVLTTRNTADFQHIEGLKLRDPLNG